MMWINLNKHIRGGVRAVGTQLADIAVILKKKIKSF